MGPVSGCAPPDPSNRKDRLPMAIVARKRKSGTAVYSVNYQNGAQVWERLPDGVDAREHGRADARIKKQIKAGTYSQTMTSAITVGTFARDWFRKRTTRS